MMGTVEALYVIRFSHMKSARPVCLAFSFLKREIDSHTPLPP